MVVDPGTAILIASAVATAAKGAGDFLGNKSEEKKGKRRAKETRRETKANMLNEALQRESELHAHKLSSRQKLAKRKANSLQETSDLVRGALNI